MELWLPHTEHVRYMISSEGRVRGPFGRVLRPRVQVGGYHTIYISGVGPRLVHRLVLETFVGPCPDGCITRHLDGDPANNMIDNLVWGTWSENGADKASHGRAKGGRHPNVKLTPEQVQAIRQDPRRQVEIAAQYGIGQAHVSDLKTGRRGTWSHLVEN